MQFSQNSGVQSPLDIIPGGALLWVMVNFRQMKNSESGGRYADMDYIVAEGQPFARKHIFDIISDPDFPGNSEAAVQMGMVALTRMAESAKIADPKSPTGYDQLNGLSCEQVLKILDGKYVAIRVKVEKGTGGYSDKNKIGEYLTPNETSSGHKNYLKLLMKDHNLPNAGNGGVGNGTFGQRPAAPAPTSQPGFGFTPAAPAPKEVEPATGFDPNKPPGWMTKPKE